MLHSILKKPFKAIHPFVTLLYLSGRKYFNNHFKKPPNPSNHTAYNNRALFPSSFFFSHQPTQATNPYLASMPTSTYSPYFPPGHLMPTLLGPADPSAVSQVGPVVQQTLVPATQQKIPRSDRLEVRFSMSNVARVGVGETPSPPPFFVIRYRFRRLIHTV